MKLITDTSALEGTRFGRLTVLLFVERSKGHIYYLCRCDCGNERRVSRAALRNGKTKSCGCLMRDINIRRSTTHGQASQGRPTREYMVWSNIKRRCLDPSNKSYKDYGGRGITVCERWLGSFEAFFENMGLCPEGYSIDRRDNEGNYEPGNCFWASREHQNSNKRSNILIEYEGRTFTLAGLARHLGLKKMSFYKLYQMRKLPLEEAIARSHKL